MQEEIEETKETQPITYILVILVILLAGGYLFYSTLHHNVRSKSSQVPAEKIQQVRQQMQAGGMDVPGGGTPFQQVGNLLGAQIYAGHFPSKTSPSSVGLTAVYKGGIGEAAGLKDGDAVLSCEGAPATCPSTLLSSLKKADTSKEVKLQIERDGKVIEVTLPARDSFKSTAEIPAQEAPSGPGCDK